VAAVRAEADAEVAVATARAEAATSAAASNIASSEAEGRKIAELAEELAAARSEVTATKKAADERVAIAMSSAVMAEQHRSELESSLNLQLAQAREEVRKEAAASQAAAVAVVATERDDAKAALLLAAKEAQDEVAEAQMLQQERVAAVEKQLVSTIFSSSSFSAVNFLKLNYVVAGACIGARGHGGRKNFGVDAAGGERCRSDRFSAVASLHGRTPGGDSWGEVSTFVE